MPVAEQYRVVRDLKFNGRQFERGDSIARDYILGSPRPEMLGTLQRTGFIELDPVTRPLDKMTKAELIDYAREVDAEVNTNMRKDDLLDAIQEVL